MPSIQVTTFIAAPRERVFDLSRHISVQKTARQHQQAAAVAGTTSGLIHQGETVTWQLKQLYGSHTVVQEVTKMSVPAFFEEQESGAWWGLFTHKHHFKSVQNGTIVIDELLFETRYGVVGRLLNQLYLNRYLRQCIEKRNNTIKAYAESRKWEALLQER